MRGVGKLGFHPHRAGGLVDLVVDHLQRAPIERRAAIGVEGFDGERACGLGRVDLRELLLRQGEEYADGPKLRDDHDARVGGAHEIAFVDHADAGAAVGGRQDRRVVEERFGVGDSGVVELDLRGKLIDEGALRVDGFLSDDVAAELGIALHVALGVGKLRLVERLLGGGLVELRLVGRRIDLDEYVAPFDVLAFLEIDAEDAAVDLRPYRHGAARLGGADTFEVQRKISDASWSDEDGHGAIAHLRGATPAGLLLLVGRTDA